MIDEKAHHAGTELRRKVFGEEHVRVMAVGADDWRAPWQDYVIEKLWGGIWTRPDLSLKHRSFITIAMLAAQGKPHELKLHLMGAQRNGVTHEEVIEVFLQVAMYAGVGRGKEAFRCAREVFSPGGSENLSAAHA